MMHLEKAHFIVDEMIMNGCIVETNKSTILDPIIALEKSWGIAVVLKIQKISDVVFLAAMLEHFKSHPSFF